MNLQKIVPKVVKNFFNNNQSKKIMSEIPKKTLAEPQMLNNRDYSLIAEKKLLTREEYRNILKNAIRQSGGGGGFEYSVGHTVPGLRYMAGNQYRTTLVFLLFFLPAWWAPWILFVFIMKKQNG